jgi:hypothetical protein
MFGVVGLCAAWEKFELPGSIVWRAQRTLRREQARLLRASTAELVAQAREAVRSERWEGFRPGRALLELENDAWTDENLVRVLEDLSVALGDDDRARGRAGRSSNEFEFYDCGLASILAALEARRRTPGASDP